MPGWMNAAHLPVAVFRQGGSYQVFFRLKQRSRVIAATSAQVQVRSGVRDGFDD